ncbi:hypothetical protein TFUB4_01493 [Tannerella forsythia]|nr:hypothetical protein TFUB4_01493 [Tannerella forsythia]SCQ22864.1 hypothetical protein TFUB22_01501 [Tannerella forsythia]
MNALLKFILYADNTTGDFSIPGETSWNSG